MDKKWFHVKYELQVRDSYAFFGTDEEMTTKLEDPDYRSREETNTGVWELTRQGNKKQRKDLVKAAFKRALEKV